MSCVETVMHIIRTTKRCIGYWGILGGGGGVSSMWECREYYGYYYFNDNNTIPYKEKYIQHVIKLALSPRPPFFFSAGINKLLLE